MSELADIEAQTEDTFKPGSTKFSIPRGHFSLEQAEAAARFFGLAPPERDFLLTLVELGRAGTPELRAYFQRHIRAQLEARSTLHQRLEPVPAALRDQERSAYYGSWLFAAAHMLAMLPGYDTAPRLAERLGVTAARLAEILGQLEAMRVIQTEGGRIKVLVERLNIPGTSPAVVQHHVNWRLRAVHAIERRDPAELHYSGVAAVAADDVPKLKEASIQAIAACAETAKNSRADELCVFTADAFRL